MNAISKADAIAEIYDAFMSSDMAIHNESAKKCIEIIQKLPPVSYDENSYKKIIESIKEGVQAFADDGGRDMETAVDVNEKVYNAGKHDVATKILKLIDKSIEQSTRQ
jgi:hypothetical protein